MPTKKSYLCMDTRGGIRAYSKFQPSEKVGVIQNGQELTAKEFTDHLFNELQKGREVIPMNGKCGVPCQNHAQCAGFDYAGNGCPGHPSED